MPYLLKHEKTGNYVFFYFMFGNEGDWDITNNRREAHRFGTKESASRFRIKNRLTQFKAVQA